MRVISGKAKGIKLKSVPGTGTRPILGRIKENLFNILDDLVRDSRWLDMFGGTGAVGIEALSRGAASVVFTDAARAAVRTIQDNLRATRLEGGTVRQSDAFAFLRTGGYEPFDIIYVAPPQYQGLWLMALRLIDELADTCLAEDGMVVVQIAPREFEAAELQRLTLVDKRRYGQTMLCFYEIDA